MTEWAPATDAEVAMRDALRTDDQESYFRILAGVDLLLPVSADALAGLAPLGWGTWSTGGRTHVLAFTSPAALQACLADYAGSARRVAYAELADTWPNLEWWLAVNPGLPIEGYLPAWFVAQLSRGDLRLPTRGPARDSGKAAQNPQDLQAAVMAANAAAARTATAQGEQAYAGSGDAPAYAGPGDAAAYAGQGDARAFAGPGAPGDPAGGTPRFGPGGTPGGPAGPAGVPRFGGAGGGSDQNEGSRFEDSPERRGGPGSGGPGFGGPGFGGPVGRPGLGRGGDGAPGFGDLRRGTPADPAARSAGASDPAAASGGFGPSAAGSGAGGATVGPGGLPIRTPGGVLPSGLPSRVPTTPASGPDTPSFPGFSPRGEAAGSGVPAGYQPPGVPGNSPTSAAPSSGVPAAYRPPGVPAGPGPGIPGRSEQGGVSSAFGRGPVGSPPGGAQGGLSGAQGGLSGAQDGLSGPQSGRLGQSGRLIPRGGSAALGGGAALGSGGPQGSGGVQGSGFESQRGGLGAQPGSNAAAQGGLASAPSQIPDGPLPTRTPMAQTPPLPSHIPPPDTEHESVDGLPRRSVTPPSERPPSMAATAQALADTRTPPPGPPTYTPPPSGIMPPVIPGAGGSARSSSVSPLPVRPELPKTPPPTAEAASTWEQGPPEQSTPPPGQKTPEQGGPGQGEPGRGASQSAAAPGTPPADDFAPANDVERDLLDAADEGSTDRFLSTLLLASVLVPVEHNSRPGSSPGEAGFVFRTEEIEGERFLVVFTSRDRLSEHFAEPTRTVGVRFFELIRNWPDPAWSFAVNPESPVGAKYPGPQVIALASWATDAGLGIDPAEVDERSMEPVPAPRKVNDAAQHATVMQKTVPAEHVDYYLERGYDRVAGFVHRANEVEHLRTPAELFSALGLVNDGSPHQADAKEAYVLRWPAYRPSLYRIPYGGQSEQALRAMDGWVIERPPFRGNGFAPGEGRDVIAEFKVDSVRLPHGAQLWRMDADGTERMVAIFDCDAPIWRRVGEQ